MLRLLYPCKVKKKIKNLYRAQKGDKVRKMTAKRSFVAAGGRRKEYLTIFATQ